MSTVELTDHRSYPLAVDTNNLSDDVEVLRLAMQMVDGDIRVGEKVREVVCAKSLGYQIRSVL